MITQFGSGGISLILDKSAFHSFGHEEILLLHRYYWVNITPILVMEVLGDLKKETDEGDLNTKRVIDFANKLFPFNSSTNTHYLNLVEAELLGNENLPLYKPIVDSAQLVQMEDGKKGVKINSSQERLAIDRWKEGNFLDSDKTLSQVWRDTTSQKDLLNNVKNHFVSSFPFFGQLKNQKDILACFDTQFNQPDFQLTTLQLFIEEFSISASKASQIFYRWEISTDKSIQNFAPYALHCMRTRFLFYIALRNGIITTRPTNWLDLEYLYYLPFCRVFLSNDKFHDEIVPYLINKNQLYIKGNLMKEDLKKIIEIKKQLTGKELLRAEKEPPHNPELLAYKIWSEMYADWPPKKDWEPSAEEHQMMNDMITKFRNAKPIDES